MRRGNKGRGGEGIASQRCPNFESQRNLFAIIYLGRALNAVRPGRRKVGGAVHYLPRDHQSHSRSRSWTAAAAKVSTIIWLSGGEPWPVPAGDTWEERSSSPLPSDGQFSLLSSRQPNFPSERSSIKRRGSLTFTPRFLICINTLSLRNYRGLRAAAAAAISIWT